MFVDAITQSQNAAFDITVSAPYCADCGKLVTPREYGYSLQHLSAPTCNECTFVGWVTLWGQCTTYTRRYLQYFGIDGQPQMSNDLLSALESMQENNWTAFALWNGFIDTTVGDYVALDGVTLSYLPASKIQETRSYEVYTASKRVTGKLGKIARKLALFPWLTDADVETFVNNVKANDPALVRDRIHIVYGEDIRDAYYVGNYSSLDTGHLSQSCMRYDYAQSFLDIYVKNPDVCGLAILRDEDDRIQARALVWTQTNGTRYLDRVYASDSVRLAFTHWAQENGIGDRHDTVQLTHATFDEYPYADTFRYLDVDTKTLSAYDNGATHCLESTDGEATILYSNESMCERCEHTYDDLEMESVETSRGEYETLCSECAERFTCWVCGEHIYDEDAETNGVCEECSAARTCDVCHCFSHYEYTNHTSDGAPLCDDCKRDYTCADCHTLLGDVGNGESPERGLSGENVCHDCAVEQSLALYGIDATAELAEQEIDRQLATKERAQAYHAAFLAGQRTIYGLAFDTYRATPYPHSDVIYTIARQIEFVGGAR